jgi:Niemann-Pick C1 protein
VHKKWNPAPWTQKDWGKFVCGKLSGLLHYRLFQGAILLITAGIFGMGMYGTLKIKIDFDPVLVLPPRSNLKLFIDESEDHYPTNGYGASVYTGGLPYTAENFEKLDAMVAKLDGMAHEGDIISYGEKLPLLSGSWDLSTGFWWTDLKDFMRKKRNVTDWRTTFADDSLRLHLSDYLHREEGAQDKINFEFEVDLECNVPAPNILASKLGAITFNDFDGPTEHIPAKDAVEKIIIEAGLPGHSFSDSTVYISWETDRIIGSELWRNMGLCLVCVFLITLVMLADIKICFMVMTCVLFTMVAVTGGLYFWNQAIDAFVCIHLVICIGLCVDYSAHVAHAFIVAEGTSVERSAYGFTEMGSAIFHGGTTTFVALSFLGLSESMIFVVFFKVFILTVIVGLFHGLIYLPVVLAVFGSDRIVKMEAEEFSKESNGMAAAAAAAATKSHSNGITNPEFVLGESA